MRLIVGNRWFWLASALILVQQALIGLSTWFIGSAGAAVSSDPGSVPRHIVCFFTAVVGAYLSGASALWTANRLANSSWDGYCKSLFEKLSGRLELSSEKNKAAANSWLCGEALSTLDHASTSFVDMLAVYLNISFTITVFFSLLGPVITASIGAALAASVLILSVAHRPIGRLAGDIQDAKLEALVAIGRVWDHLFFGSPLTAGTARGKAGERAARFFERNERYKLVEQVISCLPVLLSIPLLVWAISYETGRGAVALGALVAVLPRSLQLFANIHTANAFAGQFILMKCKLANLESFPERLERQDLDAQVRRDEISIVARDPERELTVQELIDGLPTARGRYLISGRNGSGKSSLLRALKARSADAVLLGPNILLEHDDAAGSTGERQLRAIDALIAQGVRVLMLDEWDANLDGANMETLDRRLEAHAKGALIVEIRHRRS